MRKSTCHELCVLFKTIRVFFFSSLVCMCLLCQLSPNFYFKAVITNVLYYYSVCNQLVQGLYAIRSIPGFSLGESFEFQLIIMRDTIKQRASKNANENGTNEKLAKWNRLCGKRN